MIGNISPTIGMKKLDRSGRALLGTDQYMLRIATLPERINGGMRDKQKMMTGLRPTTLLLQCHIRL